MASGRDIRAGRAFVEVFLRDKLSAGLKTLQRRVRQTGQFLTKIGGTLFGAGASVAGAFLPAIQAASNLEEVMNKFNVVFGDNAGEVKQWGDNFAGQVGRSKRQIAEFLAESQDLFVPLGFDEASATKLSKTVTELAVDLASFNNMQDADVLRDFKAALTGSGEVMKKYGVILSEAAVKQELLNQGLDPKTASDQEKVQARLAIITRGTTAAQGDAVRSAGSFANQMKRLKGTVEDAAGEIGGALWPVVTPLVTKAGNLVKQLAIWAGQNKQIVATVFKVAAGVAAVGAVLTVAGGALVGFGSVLGAAASVASFFAAVLGAIVSPVGLTIAAVLGLGGVILTQTNLASTAVGWLKETFGGLLATVTEVFAGIKAALAAGDFKLAAQILWAGLKLVWAEGIGFLEGKWIDFKEMFASVAAEGVRGVLRLFNLGTKDLAGLWTKLESIWVETTSFIGDAWDLLMARMKGGWNSTQTFLAKGIALLMSKFDDSIDVDDVFAELDAELARRNSAVDDQLNRSLSQRDRQRKAQLDEIEADRADKEQAIDDFLNDSKRKKQFAGERAASAAAIARARGELAGLLSEAGAQSASAAPSAAANAAVEKAQAGAKTALDVSAKANTGISLGSAAGINAVASALRGAALVSPDKETASNTKKLALLMEQMKQLQEKLVENTGKKPQIVEAPVG